MLLRFLGFLFTSAVILFLIGAGVVTYVVWDYSKNLPDYQALKEYSPPVMTRVHAADGSLVAEYAKERRLYLPIQAVPERVIQAFLSAEDKNFYSHFGIDPMGIARAAAKYVSSGGRVMQGASTITQQVAKNFLLTNERSFERKIKEAILSLRIERTFSKDQILELYLNEIFLGLNSYGVAAASLVYFGKSVHELTIDEAAYLAALPKAPNNYHPFRHTERAIERRNWVIDQMQENGYVTAQEASDAKARPLDVSPRQSGAQLFAADYYAEEVRREIYDRYGEKGLYEGGLSIRTSLDPQMQVLARRALIHGLTEYDRSRGWRGPFKQIELGGDWGEAIAKVEAFNDVAPWQLAVVLSVEDGQAMIGLQPQRTKSGALGSERDTGTIPLSDLAWARWATGPQKGVKIKSAKQVLTPGDVVYVEPAEESGQFSLRQVPKVEGAIVAMDPYTGRVKAMVGGFSFDESEFNRATQAQRQPGSAFKPFVYAAALDNGYTPSSVVMDAPIELEQGGRVWAPQNYGGKFYGPSTLRVGIEKSRNVMTVRLAQDMGMPLIAEYARRFGIYDNMLPVLSMSLGAGETTVLKLTTAYCMIANGGKQIKSSLIDRIQDRFGRTIFKHDERGCPECDQTDWHGQDEPEVIDERAQILDPYTAYQMTSMLEGVVQRGTAAAIRDKDRPLAGKTGTTNDERDAWFVGFSADLVVGVFIGYDNPTPMGRGMTGGHLAAPVFKDFMTAALEGQPGIPFRAPPGINLVRINAKTGLRAGPDDQGVILEAFKPGQEPPSSYSIIGYQDEFGRELTVSPEQDRAVNQGTGGLY
ncbi:MAG: penicillin-binding protein 1A [Rhodobiaceae bacterium]|nr:penicillin-binding protein 1A [Rhodobiaceae bacterium]MCC0056462.1 penicillin-binding protein 1A [Rhodobiaceae bacterium]